MAGSNTRPTYPNVVSVLNLKGGVGKTTLCVNLAYGLAWFNRRRVLLIDLDPQANATQYLMTQRNYRETYYSDPPKKLTTFEVYRERQVNDDPDIPLRSPDRFLYPVYTASDGKSYLHLVASKLELSLIGFSHSTLPTFDEIRWLIQSIGENYDVVLIDCPPTMSRLLVVALDASEFILIPVKAEFLSTIGLPLLHRVLSATYPRQGRRDPWMSDIRVLGMVLNMVDERLIMTRESVGDVEEASRRFGYPILSSHISASTKYAWSSKQALPIFRSEPKSRYAAEIRELSEEFDRVLAANTLSRRSS